MSGGLFALALALMGSACPAARATRPKNAAWPVLFRNERRSIVLARFSLTIRVVRSSIVVTPVYASKTQGRPDASGVPAAAYAVAPVPASGKSGRGEGLDENCAQPQVEPLVHWQSQQVQ